MESRFDRAGPPDDRWWREPLSHVVSGRKVVLVGGAAAGWTAAIGRLRALGARDLLVVATEGAGAGPQPEARVMIERPPPGDGMMSAMRGAISLIGHPTAAMRAAIADFDPHGSAIYLGHFLNESPSIDGRPFLAHRRPEWVALEDKTVLAELLASAGITSAPSAVVALVDAAGTRHELDLGSGTVWAADSTSGFHGGAAGTRWVVSDDDAVRVTSELGREAQDVRIMPFLEGIATSIHGIVLPDGIATVRPVELVTLRRGRDLVYSGCATFWDPADDVRAEMQQAARRLGDVLRHQVDFRGAFTIDGIATSSGFRPTELNPRFGAGLGVMTRGKPDLPPIPLVLDLIVGGYPLDISAAELEALLVTSADAQRAGGTWNLHVDLSGEIAERAACFDGERWRWAHDGEDADAVVVGAGDFASARFVPERTPVGPSVGAPAAAFWQFFDDEHGTHVGPLTAPRDVTVR